MLFELLKNAAYATVEHHGAIEAKNHPIRVTMVHSTKNLLVRVSDEGGGIPPWGGLQPVLDPLSEGLLGSGPLPTLTSERLDIFSFSHMRRLHLHHQASGYTGGLNALRNVGKLAGTFSEQREATDLVDAQMKSGIGLPLVSLYLSSYCDY